MRILALDIGSHSIKAVELDATFGRVELADYTIEPVFEPELAEVHAGAAPAGAEANAESIVPPRRVLTEGQLGAIRQLLATRHNKIDRLVVNVPRAWTTTRLFNFPTKDRKTIQNSLAFELDDDIPFSQDEVVSDFAILSSEGPGSTVFAAVALKTDITHIVSELQLQSLDPDTISIESWGMSHLLKRSIPKEYQGRPVCIINMGSRNTAVHMLINEAPVLTHVSPCAGMDVTRAIAQSYNLGFDDAEKAKVDGAFLLTKAHISGAADQLAADTAAESAQPPTPTAPITPEQKQFADVISESLSPLVREIKQTLMSYKAQYKMSPRAIFITGGTSLIPNMQLFLEEQLHIPVFTFAYMSQVVGQTLQLSESSEAHIAAATGLGLSVVKMDRHAHINFRKDEFAKAGAIGALDFNAFKGPLKYLAASLVFIFVNLLVQGLILSSRASKQEEALAKSMKAVLGALSPSSIATYRNSPTALKSAVNKELAKYKPTAAAPPKVQTSAFDVLNKVSQSMPKDGMRLDVSEFQIKDGKLKLTGTVDSNLAPDRIKKALEDSGTLEAVTKDKAEEDHKTHKTRFELSAKVSDAKTR